jgi:flavorubredoxin
MLEMMKGLKFKGKNAAAFGSYGWSGEAVKQISEHLKNAGFEMVGDGLRTLWVPDDMALGACAAYGEAFAKAIAG